MLKGSWLLETEGVEHTAGVNYTSIHLKLTAFYSQLGQKSFNFFLSKAFTISWLYIENVM